MSLYESVAPLPLHVESYELERHELPVSSGFTRVTTVIHLRGAGEEGVGEDVTYDAAQHPPPADLPLAGEHTLDSLSALLEPLELVALQTKRQLGEGVVEAHERVRSATVSTCGVCGNMSTGRARSSR